MTTRRCENPRRCAWDAARERTHDAIARTSRDRTCSAPIAKKSALKPPDADKCHADRVCRARAEDTGPSPRMQTRRQAAARAARAASNPRRVTVTRIQHTKRRTPSLCVARHATGMCRRQFRSAGECSRSGPGRADRQTPAQTNAGRTMRSARAASNPRRATVTRIQHTKRRTPSSCVARHATGMCRRQFRSAGECSRSGPGRADRQTPARTDPGRAMRPDPYGRAAFAAAIDAEPTPRGQARRRPTSPIRRPEGEQHPSCSIRGRCDRL